MEVHSGPLADWDEFQAGKIDRSVLIKQIDLIAWELKQELEKGCESSDKKTRAFCKKLQSIYPDLWNFSRIPEAEPTNNYGEQTVKVAVIWRKSSYKHQSKQGQRFAERMLSVVTMLKLRNLDMLDILDESIKSYRQIQSNIQIQSLIQN